MEMYSIHSAIQLNIPPEQNGSQCKGTDISHPWSKCSVSVKYRYTSENDSHYPITTEW